MPALLEVRDLLAGYGAIQALRGVTITVSEGTVTALLGPNGAGKSTFLRALSGLVRVHKGSIRFGGEELIGLSAPLIVRRGLVHVPEGREVFASLSVRDNLLLGAYRFGQPSASELERVFGLFPRLAERAGQPAGTLSGGEQQMLALARGLLSRPRLLLLDEPSLGLSPLIIRTLYLALKELKSRGLAMLLAEQNARHALELADHGYVLANGRIQLHGTGDELMKNENVVSAYFGRQA